MATAPAPCGSHSVGWQGQYCLARTPKGAEEAEGLESAFLPAEPVAVAPPMPRAADAPGHVPVLRAVPTKLPTGGRQVVFPAKLSMGDDTRLLQASRLCPGGPPPPHRCQA